MCDALEGKAPHGEHVGHHSHAADHAQTHDDTDPEVPGNSQQGGADHNHSHAHPLLSWLVPVDLALPLPQMTGKGVSLPPLGFVSSLPHRLERPPRVFLVA